MSNLASAPMSSLLILDSRLTSIIVYMATSTIIELSRYTSDDSVSPSQWKNSLKSSIIIEAGDQVLLKNCFVDTTGLSSNNFVFSTPVQLRISFGFYLMGTGIEMIDLSNRVGKTWDLANTSTADGLPYVAITTENDPADDQVYEDFVDFTILPGTYSKTGLAEVISRQLQQIANVANQRMNGVFSHAEQYPGFDLPVLESIYQPMHGSKEGNKWAFAAASGPFANPPFSPAYKDIHFRNFLINLPNNVEYQHSTIFQSCGGDPEQANSLDCGYIGCANASMSFNSESQIFQWDYLHQSIEDNSGNQVVGIAQQQVLNNFKLSFLNSRCGIFLTGLSPPDFWTNTMGFELDRILVDKTQVLQGQYDYDTWYQRTTFNFPSVSQLIDTDAEVTLGSYKIQSAKTILSPASFPVWKFTQSTATVPVAAPNISKGTVISGGHFLVDIKGYNSQYKNAFGDTQYKGLVSSYFVSPDSFVCAVGPDSSFYVHQGSPMSLNSFEISIINPLTHQPATNIGENSSVYLQVVKQNKELQDQSN